MGTDGMSPRSYGEGMPPAYISADFSADALMGPFNPDDVYFADDHENPTVAGRVGDLKAQGILDENGCFTQDYLAARRPIDPPV